MLLKMEKEQMSKSIKRPVGFFKKIILKILTKAQVFAINRMMKIKPLSNRARHKITLYHNLYMKITKLHFKLYFNLDLIREASLGTLEFFSAAERHKLMVVDSTKKINGIYLGEKREKDIKQAFRDYLLLETPL